MNWKYLQKIVIFMFGLVSAYSQGMNMCESIKTAEQSTQYIFREESFFFPTVSPQEIDLVLDYTELVSVKNVERLTPKRTIHKPYNQQLNRYNIEARVRKQIALSPKNVMSSHHIRTILGEYKRLASLIHLLIHPKKTAQKTDKMPLLFFAVEKYSYTCVWALLERVFELAMSTTKQQYELQNHLQRAVVLAQNNTEKDKIIPYLQQHIVLLEKE